MKGSRETLGDGHNKGMSRPCFDLLWMQMELGGAVALVTGAARNIGRAIALELAAAGAAVIVNAKTSQVEAQGVADEIEASGGRATVMIADVTDPAAVAAMIAETVERYGRLDVLVNNAAVRDESLFGDMTFARWHAVLAVVLDGAFLCTQSALPHLRASGRGAVVNLGGLTAHTGASHRAHVVTAKAGIVGLTRALAHELSAEQITVNCVVPGLIETVRAGKPPTHRAGKTTLVGRNGTPGDVAGTVRWLAGPAARYVTGQTIHVNGGVYLS
jgi:3-oxoacyl-[acyl-carrier protein] reductase